MGQQVAGAVVVRARGGVRPAVADGVTVPPVRHLAALVATGLAVLLGLATAGVGLAAPAAAHDRLVSSDPADGAVLPTPPAQLVLTFSAEPLAVGAAAVVVTGPDGATWSDGPAVIAGTTVTQPLRAGMPAGAYAVAWQSPSSDGHVLDGTLAFTVEAAAPVAEPTADPTAEPTGEPTPEPTPEPTADATSEPSDEPTAGATADDAGDVPGSDPGPWLLAGLAVVVVAGLALAVVLRRRGGGAA